MQPGGDSYYAAALPELVRCAHALGDLPELASALVGEGRCLVALGAPGADGPLREARELYTTMG